MRPMGSSISLTSSRFTAVSSTTSRRRVGQSSGAIGSGVTAASPRASGAGISNQNVDPRPVSLRTPICPPIRLTIALLIARPRPVPP